MSALLCVFIPAGKRTGCVTLLAVSAVMLSAGCGGDSVRTPGDQGVYDSIAATTDCKELQSIFDRNMDDTERRSVDDPLRDVVFGYAQAAQDRIEELGC